MEWTKSRDLHQSKIVQHRTTIYTEHPHNKGMGIRDSFSKLRERLDPKSKGRKHKPGGTGSGTDGEGVDQVGSLPRLVSDVVVGGHCGGGAGSNPDPCQVHLADQLPQPDEPESVSNEQEVEGGADVDGGEADQRHSHLHTDAGVVPGSGSGQEEDAEKEEGDQSCSCSRSSTPSTPRGGNSNGA